MRRFLRSAELRRVFRFAELVAKFLFRCAELVGFSASRNSSQLSLLLGSSAPLLLGSSLRFSSPVSFKNQLIILVFAVISVIFALNKYCGVEQW